MREKCTYNQLSYDLAIEYCQKEVRAAKKKQFFDAGYYAILSDFWHDMALLLGERI